MEDLKKHLTTDIISRNTPDEIIYYMIHTFEQYRTNTNISLEVRKHFWPIFGYFIPSKRDIKKLCDFIGSSSVLEVGAGLGFISHLLRCQGINLDAIDIHKPEKTWTKIKLSNCVEAIQQYNYDCLFLCYGNHILKKCMDNFKGDKIIIIGEGYGGCTDALIENNGLRVYETNDQELSTETYDYKLVCRIEIPEWYPYTDSIFFYERNK